MNDGLLLQECELPSTPVPCHKSTTHFQATGSTSPLTSLVSLPWSHIPLHTWNLILTSRKWHQHIEIFLCPIQVSSLNWQHMYMISINFLVFVYIFFLRTDTSACSGHLNILRMSSYLWDILKRTVKPRIKVGQNYIYICFASVFDGWVLY